MMGYTKKKFCRLSFASMSEIKPVRNMDGRDEFKRTRFSPFDYGILKTIQTLMEI